MLRTNAAIYEEVKLIRVDTKLLHQDVKQIGLLSDHMSSVLLPSLRIDSLAALRECSQSNPIDSLALIERERESWGPMTTRGEQQGAKKRVCLRAICPIWLRLWWLPCSRLLLTCRCRPLSISPTTHSSPRWRAIAK